LAKQQLHVIYGGGKVGLMGALADAALFDGGRVTGIIPDFMMQREIAHTGLSDLIVVDSMHSRKRQMHERSDAVITLPGGFGTLEELFEILTWVQLGIYRKPIGILNLNGYYDALETQLDHMSAEGLLRDTHRRLLIFEQSIPALFDKMLRADIPEPLFKIGPSEM
jgi:uncharacterized protein (TIGR00730 family)